MPPSWKQKLALAWRNLRAQIQAGDQGNLRDQYKPSLCQKCQTTVAVRLESFRTDRCTRLVLHETWAALELSASSGCDLCRLLRYCCLVSPSLGQEPEPESGPLRLEGTRLEPHR